MNNASKVTITDEEEHLEELYKPLTTDNKDLKVKDLTSNQSTTFFEDNHFKIHETYPLIFDRDETNEGKEPRTPSKLNIPHSLFSTPNQELQKGQDRYLQKLDMNLINPNDSKEEVADNPEVHHSASEVPPSIEKPKDQQIYKDSEYKLSRIHISINMHISIKYFLYVHLILLNATQILKIKDSTNLPPLGKNNNKTSFCTSSTPKPSQFPSRNNHQYNYNILHFYSISVPLPFPSMKITKKTSTNYPPLPTTWKVVNTKTITAIYPSPHPPLGNHPTSLLPSFPSMRNIKFLTIIYPFLLTIGKNFLILHDVTPPHPPIYPQPTYHKQPSTNPYPPLPPFWNF